MSLEYIIKRTAQAAGIKDLSVGSDERSWLINIINEAAEELWEHTDLPGSLRECFINVSSDRIIALPAYMGELRAIRECKYYSVWRLADMAPRFHANPWPSMWNNWRHLGYSPVLDDVTNAAPLTYKTAEADSDLIITTSGTTTVAAREHDLVTMTQTPIVGTKNFSAIETIVTNKLASYNVEVYDADGKLMSVIFNNTKNAQFSLYDIATYPSVDFVMEALYKIRLPWLENDADSFPIPDYDTLVIMKVKQLFAEDDENGADRALLMAQKINYRLAEKEKQKGATNDRSIGFGYNRFTGLYKGQHWGRRYRSNRFWWGP